ncbi:MAG TPA: SDR family oxidoreductase [Methylophaga aminisulfidivorans]|nr:SDR family oxidoreductase [Methylophaga sp.]HIM38711.1 SDR family oxidoreductase [Methylophaga aminisulfidivorans]
MHPTVIRPSSPCMEHNGAMSILLTGATGYVGQHIKTAFDSEWQILGVSQHGDIDQNIAACDLSDERAVVELAQTVSPDVIIHAAGDKNIQRCERDPSLAYQANVQTTLNLIKAFPDAKIIYISSDYVFSGDRGGYRETDPISPLTVYGKTKASAELNGLILSDQFYVLRLSALYDGEATFLRFLREQLQSGKAVDCFDDAFYSPTFYKDFLNVLDKLVMTPKLSNRVYHVCGQRISRFFFAKLFARSAGFDDELILQASRLHGEVPFLFGDLSLENTMTCESLDVTIGTHHAYLNSLEVLDENSIAVSNL